MLQAVIRGKLTGVMKEGRSVPEDLVTDCLFGALRYLEPRESGMALAWLFPDLGALKGSRVLDVDLWPPRQNGREPDAVVVCTTADDTRLTLIVEVKWCGGSLGERQALDQWEGFAYTSAKGSAFHQLILCDERTQVERRLEEDDSFLLSTSRLAHASSWKASRSVVLWHDVARRLRDWPIMQGSISVGRWVKDFRNVLERLGKRPFDGFGRDAQMQQPLTWDGGTLFWSKRGAYAWPDMPVTFSAQPLFWNPGERART